MDLVKQNKMHYFLWKCKKGIVDLLDREWVEKILIIFHKVDGSEVGFVPLLRQMNVAAGKD